MSASCWTSHYKTGPQLLVPVRHCKLASGVLFCVGPMPAMSSFSSSSWLCPTLCIFQLCNVHCQSVGLEQAGFASSGNLLTKKRLLKWWTFLVWPPVQAFRCPSLSSINRAFTAEFPMFRCWRHVPTLRVPILPICRALRIERIVTPYKDYSINLNSRGADLRNGIILDIILFNPCYRLDIYTFKLTS